jgi:hypothetical protein
MQDANRFMDGIFRFYGFGKKKDSMDFSDKLSYKILFILSYGLEDMNLARFKYLQQFFQKNREGLELFSPTEKLARVARTRDRGADWKWGCGAGVDRG